ncbi:MAG: HAD family phosphatase [Sphingobacteriia bacterium]|nr:HAD family phosphatase [Sphingobacteriia bacterium]NCC38818.1 HAD family phosphatase [Gammaproteobacteria bacterium]
MDGKTAQLIHNCQLILLDFDGVVTTEAEDVSLKAQTLSVFAAIAARFGERPLKMVRLASRAIYNAGGTVQLGPLLYHAAQLLKPQDEPLEPTLARLIDACTNALDFRGIAAAGAVIHDGLAHLERLGIEVAVFTNGLRENVLRVLAVKQLTHLFAPEHLFDAISTLDKRGQLHPKPDPVGYRFVLDELGVKPQHCVVVDNSRKNVRAAKRDVGCGRVVYIGSGLKRKDRPLIDHAAPSLEHLMAELAFA